MRIAAFAVLLAAVASACTTPATVAARLPTATIAMPSPVSLTSTPVPPTASLTSTMMPTAFVPFSVTTWADNVLLRSNPGYLFSRIATLRQGASLLVLAKSPGGEWLLCQTADHQVGWVFAQLVESSAGNFGGAPVIWPPSVQTLQGRVTDRSGVPISGIQFSIIQGEGIGAPRNDAITDASGVFYAFMPPEAAGTWLVSYTAVSCKSNTMDANCNCVAGTCGMPDPQSLRVDLPLSQGQELEFTWR